MYTFMTPDEAITLIKDGDVVGINAFLSIANPVELHYALSRRAANGGLRDLTLFCSAGFGDWDAESEIEGAIRAGAVSRVVLGHLGSMPTAGAMILDEKIEGYNLPLGVMSHMIRAAAGGKAFYMSHIGLNLFVDPTVSGCSLNSVSRCDFVRRVDIDGRPLLVYKTPELDVALIKGTSADQMGNISFEKECATIDALAMAQAVHRRGGKVIVQVERVIDDHLRPRNVIVPGILVDAIVVCPAQRQLVTVEGYEPTYSGDRYIPPQEMTEWARRRSGSYVGDQTRLFIAERAYRFLKRGQVVNIGIGMPESLAIVAAREGLLQDITLTVESGSIGGLPASGTSFGAMQGADMICDMSQQFDFYDGGGLDITFIGALEIDGDGNVNAHLTSGRLTGIGGLANITQSTPVVVFCGTFTAGGLKTEICGKQLEIIQEGRHRKFVENVSAVSFSAKNARESGQKVYYVTERCIFTLTERGLALIEVAEGVDLERDVLSLLPFEVEVRLEAEIS